MVEKVPIITLLLTLFFNGFILVMFFPLWKKEKYQEFDSGIKYIGFRKRLLAFLIDACIWYSIIYILRQFDLEKMFITHWVHLIIIEITKAILLSCIVTFFIVKYGGTPGKILLNIRIVSIRGGNLSIGRAILRQIITITSTITLALQQYYIISMYVIIDKAVQSGDFSSFYDFRIDVLVLTITGFILPVVFLSDVLLILSNKRKRAIHDFLANSIVVQK